jgi:hypothetical protein
VKKSILIIVYYLKTKMSAEGENYIKFSFVESEWQGVPQCTIDYLQHVEKQIINQYPFFKTLSTRINDVKSDL